MKGQQASGGPSLARPACPSPLVLVLAAAFYLLSPAAPLADIMIPTTFDNYYVQTPPVRCVVAPLLRSIGCCSHTHWKILLPWLPLLL